MAVAIIIGACTFAPPSEFTGPPPSLTGAAVVRLAAGLLAGVDGPRGKEQAEGGTPVVEVLATGWG